MANQPTLKDLPISCIVADEVFQFRRGDLQIEPLARSIAASGQIVPIIVRPQSAGKWQLISGNRRVAALKSLGRKTARALILDALSDREAVNVSLLENLHREGLSDYDKVSTAAGLFAEGMSKPEIAKGFGQSVRSIERLIALGKAPADYQEALQRGEITIIQAYEAFRRGVPASDVISGKRSVSFLRQVAQRSTNVRSRRLSVTLQFTPGKTDPDGVIAEAERFISQVRSAAKQVEREGALTPSRRSRHRGQQATRGG